MSFLTHSGRRAVAVLPRVATQAPRFTTTSHVQKNPVESAKDGLKSVDREVSDKLVDGINAAEKAGSKVKESAQNLTGGKTAASKAEELKGEAKGAAEQAKGKAKSAAQDVKDKF